MGQEIVLNARGRLGTGECSQRFVEQGIRTGVETESESGSIRRNSKDKESNELVEELFVTRVPSSTVEVG